MQEQKKRLEELTERISPDPARNRAGMTPPLFQRSAAPFERCQRRTMTWEMRSVSSSSLFFCSCIYSYSFFQL